MLIKIEMNIVIDEIKMDLAPLQLPETFALPRNALIRCEYTYIKSPPKRCFFCKQQTCTTDMCTKKHAFHASPLGTCQMCFEIDNKVKFEDSEYELYNCMCDKHEPLILECIIKSDLQKFTH